MEVIIVYKEEFENKINELIDILIIEKYFSFEEYAIDYVDGIYDFILANIQYPISKSSPAKFQKHGKSFIKYTANKRTTWYIFFDQKESKFLVNHILNNHSQDFTELL